MMKTLSSTKIIPNLNILGLLGICAILIVAFYYQIILHEIPCPLCLLQRVGIIMIGIGFLFNLILGINQRHYSIIIFSSIATCMTATRQVLIHILPGDPGYYSTVFGLHLYTWSLLFSLAIILFISVLMLFNAAEIQVAKSPAREIAIYLFMFLIFANLISTILECGLTQCVDNPTFYKLLN
ncbi:disulfide bond formation protein B [Arsenophonus sp. aPb]|uniref:disulfide bond formation protein B n=1 Tax=Arsenophonus sp. aPb TaxID=3041619 RepID=UPI0024686398|nr:disulfide bond formation protein B [Arsenophonus sp. aPb]WGL98935.1 disulfide bond formation protein B [Arsenophonus sp. aPb]